MKAVEKHLPLSEATCYIMLSMLEPIHGYAIMQQVEAVSRGTVRLGPGTLYGAFETLERGGMIRLVAERGRRKLYQLTDRGREVLQAQIQRTAILVEAGRSALAEYDRGGIP